MCGSDVVDVFAEQRQPRAFAREDQQQREHHDLMVTVRMQRLILMCGLPGSGKTTLATTIAQELSCLRLSPDEWMIDLGLDGYDEQALTRVEALQWKLAQEELQRGHTVILENGFWSRSERDVYRLRARDLGAQVELRYLAADVDTLWS